MDLHDFLSILWKRRLLVLLVVVLSAGLGTAFALSREKTYESTATISVTSDPTTTGLVPSDYLSALLGTYAEKVDSQSVIGPAQQSLGRPITGDVKGSTEQGTGILRITVDAHRPAAAQAAATAVANAFLASIKNDTRVVAELINPAARPSQPVQPHPPLIIATSTIVGLGAAILLALAVDRFRRRIETPADLVELTQVPLIGQIPRSRDLLRSRPKIIWDDPRYVDLQESFRSLRTNLRFVVEGDQVLQVTSATAEQGKSTLVANLGLTFAQMDVNTVIVDADLRRPAQHQIFDVDGRRGVSLAASRRGIPRPQDTRFPNLAVLPSGPPLDDPTDVLQVRFARILESLRGSYDFVLIDSPPALPVSDARITAGWADGLLLVVAAGNEKPSAVTHAIEELVLAGADLKGIVLNRSTAVGGGYGYYRSDALSPEAVAGAGRTPAARGGGKAGSST